MIDLPSTTYIDPPRRMPKEAFYRHLKLSTKAKDEFIHFIERIQMLAVVKPSTMNIADGVDVHEIDMLEILVRGNQIPKLAIEAIAQANSNKILFICSFEGDFDGTYHHVVYRKGMIWEGPDRKGCLGIHYPNVADARSLDELWDRTCSRIIFDDDAILNVDERIEKVQKAEALAKNIERLEKAHGREKQIAKRNELFKQLRKAKCEYESLVEG